MNLFPYHKSHQPKKAFSMEEDKIILQYVSHFGSKDFCQITRYLPKRKSRQVQERWKLYLNPSVKREPFSPEEDAQLVQQYITLKGKGVKLQRFSQEEQIFY
jgi:hypothetical protein